MQLIVNFGGQLRSIVGADKVCLEFAEEPSISDVFQQLVARDNDRLHTFLLDADGHRNRNILVFINQVQVLPQDDRGVGAQDSITLLSPMSGG